MMTLVIGGAASGKSAYAESLICGIPDNCCEDPNCCEHQGAARRFYIATMQPFGKEAEDRIRKHRAMRADKGFETLECFSARSIRVLSLPPGAAVLLEDLGNLCANELFSEETEIVTAAEAVTAAVSALRDQCGELVIVTNEVFSGGAEYEGETLSYLRMLGQVNIALAALADRVTEVQCGVPVMIKDVRRDEIGTGEKRPGMVFVTGPMFSGKRAAAEKLFGKEIRSISEVQVLAAGCRDEKELEQLADKLSEYDVVISTETGCGVVPMDPAEREAREKAGRLNCLLAARAEKVIRVFCGIPQVIREASRPSDIQQQ